MLAFANLGSKPPEIFTQMKASNFSDQKQNWVVLGHLLGVGQKSMEQSSILEKKTKMQHFISKS